jgi:hypothetical protein
MHSDSKRSSRSVWWPAVFCAFLAVLALVERHTLSALNTNRSPGLPTAFLCFLPVCFVFMGNVVSRLQSEIRELRQKVADLQKKNGH